MFSSKNTAHSPIIMLKKMSKFHDFIILYNKECVLCSRSAGFGAWPAVEFYLCEAQVLAGLISLAVDEDERSSSCTCSNARDAVYWQNTNSQHTHHERKTHLEVCEIFQYLSHNCFLLLQNISVYLCKRDRCLIFEKEMLFPSRTKLRTWRSLWNVCVCVKKVKWHH